MFRFRLLPPLLLIVLSACGAPNPMEPGAATSESHDTTTSTSTTDLVETSVKVEDCGLAECDAGFKIGDDVYLDRCGSLPDDWVLDVILFRTDRGTIQVIDGIDPTLLVAANFSDLCGQTDDYRWAAIVPPTGIDAYPQPLCQRSILTGEQRREVGCDQVASKTRDAALELMTRFVDALRAGDPETAARLWSGYPYGGDELDQAFTTFAADFAWIASDSEVPDMFVVPAFGWGSPALPIVVLQSRSSGLTSVGAFLVDQPADSARLSIVRLPARSEAESLFTLRTVLHAGEEIVLPFVPVEGDARAFVGTQELEEVIVNHETITTTIILPAVLQPGPAVLTISAATPEYPTSFAIGFTAA